MTDDPLRLRDDPGVSAEVRAHLRRAAESTDVGYDVVNGLARLSASIVAGPSGTGGSQAPPSTSGGAQGTAAGSATSGAIPGGTSATGAVTPATIGAFAGGAIAIGAIVGAIWTTRGAPVGGESAPTQSSMVEASALPVSTEGSADSPPAPTTTSAAPMPDPLPVGAQEAEGVGEAPSPGRERVAPRGATTPSSTAGAASASTSIPKELRTREEIEHLAQVRASAASDPARAVTLADEGHRKFSGGMLHQEREALAITALTRLGRTGEARARASRFLARYGDGPFAEGVRRATGVDTP